MDLTIDQIVHLRSLVAPEPPQWSPDGTQIAFGSGLAGDQEIWSISPEGGFPTRLTTGIGSVRFLGSRNMRWSPDGRWIAFTSEKNGASEVCLWSTQNGNSFPLTHLGANIDTLNWSPDSQSLVLSGNRYGSYDIYTVRVPSGEAKRLTSGPLYDVYPVFTPDGEDVIYVGLNEGWTDHTIMTLPVDGGVGRAIHRDTNLFDYHYGQTFGYPVVSPNGKTILFRSHRSGFMNYWQVSIEGGQARPFCPEAADHSEATWAPDGRRIAYIANHNGTLELRVAATDGTLLGTPVAPEMGACSLPQWSPDGKQIAYLYQSPTAPLDLWVVSVETGKTRQLTHSMLGGGIEKRLVVPEKIVYPSFDGLPIHAYLYRPADIPAGAKLPGLLWIHGGPTSQWFDAFYAHSQYFVTQGYVVLMPNIRGSTGYGRDFEDRNLKDYGGGDLNDAVAGAEYLKTLEYINPGKMAITGTSYGGNLTMAAVCFAPDVFQAAIAASGYSSQSDRMGMGGEDEQELRHRQRLAYALGPFEENKELYRRVSPLYFTKQVRTPIFVLHGEGKRPRSNASLDFAKALERDYKTIKYRAYPNEGYYVQSLTNTRQMWLDMSDFLTTYLGD